VAVGTGVAVAAGLTVAAVAGEVAAGAARGGGVAVGWGVAFGWAVAVGFSPPPPHAATRRAMPPAMPRALTKTGTLAIVRPSRTVRPIRGPLRAPCPAALCAVSLAQLHDKVAALRSRDPRTEAMPYERKPEVINGSGTDRAIRLVMGLVSGLIRDAVRAALSRSDEVEVVGEAEDLATLQTLVETLRPDVVLVSTTLLGPHSLLREPDSQGQVKVVLLAAASTPEHLTECLTREPEALLPPGIHVVDLVTVVNLVKSNLVVYPASVRRVSGPRMMPGRLAGGTTLSNRELQVLQLTASGITEKDASVRLGIGKRTLQTYLARIVLKLGAANRIHAVAIAAAAGLVSLPGPAQSYEGPP